MKTAQDRQIERFVRALTPEQKGSILFRQMMEQEPRRAAQILREVEATTPSANGRKVALRVWRAAHQEGPGKTAREEILLAIRNLDARTRAIVGMLGRLEVVEEFNTFLPGLLEEIEQPAAIWRALAEVGACDDLAVSTIETAYREWVE